MRRILSIAAVAFTLSPLRAQIPGTHLEIRTANGQTTFHIGERIPLILSFTGPEKPYKIAQYNWGRMDPRRLESFAITPTSGWSDALATYAVLSELGCCGATQEGSLSLNPFTIPVDLNEWARFDEPGTYTLSITSHRIIIPGKTTPNNRTDLPSNPLQLHIIPATPAWQRSTLTHALKAISIPDDENAAQISPQKLSAIADLRYLDSPPAIAALAASVLVDYDHVTTDAMLGIIALPHKLRDVGLAAMNTLIDDPRFPVSISFLQTMAWLQMDDAPPPTLETPTEYQTFRSAHQSAMQPLLDAAWQATASQLSRKTAPARSVTAQTLVAMPPAHPSTETLQFIGAALRESFPTLSETSKRNLLADQWETIGSRSLLPQLRSIATAPITDDERREMIFGRSLRVLALNRWYELEPEAATAEILRELNTKNPELSADDLDFLPQQTFPQFEDLWAQAFIDGNDIHNNGKIASLLIRFGTGSAVSRITPLLTQPSSDYACNRRDEALAYLIKFDPQSARNFLNKPPAKLPVNQAACLTGQISFIGNLVQNPVLTEAALAAITVTNDGTVTDALTYLRRYDDTSARAPILARYLQWSEAQRSKPAVPPDEENPPSDRDEPTYDQKRQAQDDRDLGGELARTLLANQAWLPDADLIATVTDHCVVKQVCDSIKDLIKPQLDVIVTPPHEEYDLHIGPFDPATLALFEVKLDQFPKGTVFTLEHVSTGNDAAQNKFEASMPDLFARHGMKLLPIAP